MEYCYWQSNQISLKGVQSCALEGTPLFPYFLGWRKLQSADLQIIKDCMMKATGILFDRKAEMKVPAKSRRFCNLM